MKISSPSLLLRVIQWLVRHRWLTRGYGTLLTQLPSVLWGGAHILADTSLGSMVTDVRDPGCVSYILFGCIPHEIHETQLIRRLACRFQVTIDIGAHIGWYSLLMWQSMQGNKQIFAFEPNPYTFQCLQKNVQNKSGLFALQQAVGNTNSIVQFYCADSSNLSSASRMVGKQIEVQGQTLDQFCLSRGLVGKVDFVKCDVEGGEVEVLRGATILRNSLRPPIWMLEMDNLFLAEAGNSIEIANNEVLDVSEKVSLFCVTNNGNIRSIGHVGDGLGAHNLFVVPQSRLDYFLACATKQD